MTVGRRFGVTARASQWWLGDWLRYGAKKWGEKYKEASAITGYDIQTLKNYAYVAGQFESSRRRDALTWSHHEVVAPLLPAEQDEWLDQATQHRFSVADLRIEVRHLRKTREPRPSITAAEPTDEQGQPTFKCPQCGAELIVPRGHDGGTSPADHQAADCD